ncbi:putative CxxC motif protein [Halorubrum virus Serpecor1]|uniref:Putative CxxC motif protein n=1 Tax=Halorubrum virus Serpecor1 TaxID=2721757 RepID=A0A6G9RXU3_9CAUD|nr:putative CxxC motif protein [Halorubrum virus Serpecor1]QIR31170.1 putative CxxC motif protein [Halorubrum virus Serpecor1]
MNCYNCGYHAPDSGNCPTCGVLLVDFRIEGQVLQDGQTRKLRV